MAVHTVDNRGGHLDIYSPVSVVVQAAEGQLLSSLLRDTTVDPHVWAIDDKYGKSYELLDSVGMESENYWEDLEAYIYEPIYGLTVYMTRPNVIAVREIGGGGDKLTVFKTDQETPRDRQARQRIERQAAQSQERQRVQLQERQAAQLQERQATQSQERQRVQSQERQASEHAKLYSKILEMQQTQEAERKSALQADDGTCLHIDDESGLPMDSVSTDTLEEDDIVVRIYDTTSRKGVCFLLGTMLAHFGNIIETAQKRVIIGDVDGYVIGGTT